jgi:hypothetical protein
MSFRCDPGISSPLNVYKEETVVIDNELRGALHTPLHAALTLFQIAPAAKVDIYPQTP